MEQRLVQTETEAATEGGDIEAFNEAMENVVLLEEALAEVALTVRLFLAHLDS